jgi:hypothetical protein
MTRLPQAEREFGFGASFASRGGSTPESPTLFDRSPQTGLGHWDRDLRFFCLALTDGLGSDHQGKAAQGPNVCGMLKSAHFVHFSLEFVFAQPHVLARTATDGCASTSLIRYQEKQVNLGCLKFARAP